MTGDEQVVLDEAADEVLRRRAVAAGDSELAARLRALTAATIAMHAAVALSATLDEIARHARSVMRATGAAVQITDPTLSAGVRDHSVDGDTPTARAESKPAARRLLSVLFDNVEETVLLPTDQLRRREAYRDLVDLLGGEWPWRSVLVVPLVGADRARLGTLRLWDPGGDDPTPVDLALAAQFAQLAGLAVDHALRHERDHSIALQLQRSLLPRRLPQVPGARVRARYLPASEGAEVGGDWYDVFPLSGGRYGLVLGDVAGHGITSAASMGQLRMGLRAYAVEDDSPGEVVSRLNRLATGLDVRELATLVFLVWDPAERSGRMVRAGHPPPLVVGPSGCRVVDAPGGPPVGVVPWADYPEVPVSLHPGETLVLYTDGLIEKRRASLDDGLDRLVRWCSDVGPDPDALADRAVAELVGAAGAEDDVAILALGVDIPTGTSLWLQVPARARELAGVRAHLRRWLADVGADRTESMDLITAAEEACANVVEHAYGTADGEVLLTATCEGVQVELQVRDRGTWRTPRAGDRGRGLGLMRALSDSVDVRSDPGSGTVVVIRRRIGAGTS